MRRLSAGALTLLLAPLLLLITGLGLIQPAQAADGAGATIDHAKVTDKGLQMLISVPSDAGAADLTGITVQVGDADVTSTAVAASSSDAIKRISILAIDTSASMRGERIAEAKRAADTYLSTAPKNVRIGVLTFDDRVRLLVKPTLDRDAARAAVGDLTLTKNTALYDGVLGALDAVGDDAAGQRRILVLSDGKDTTSTKLSDVTDKITQSGAQVDVVSLQQSDSGSQPLRDMAEAGKGAVLDASEPAALSAAFAKEASALARQVLVTAEVPSGSKENANVQVSVPTATTTLVTSAYLPVRVAADPLTAAIPKAVDPGQFEISNRVVMGGVAAIALGLLGAIVALGMRKDSSDDEGWLGRQIGVYGAAGAAARAEVEAREQAAAQSFTGQARRAAEKALANNKSLEARLESKLDTAGVDLKPSEWLLLRAGVAVLAGIIGIFVAAGNIIFGLLFIVAGFVVPGIYLRFKRRRRLAAFSMGLADTLQLMSGSLSAGLSLAQSIDTIVREGNEPIASEFRRVVIESRLGVQLEDSLDGVAQRMESRDWEWVVMAIRIQREVGGNLAELLLGVAETLRERDYLRRHVRALSAEGRLSCYILGGLPPGFLVFLTLTKPDYVHPLYHTPIGYILLTVIAILLGVGVFWMSKVSKVDLS